MAEITHYNVTVITKGISISIAVREEVVYLSYFLVYQPNVSYTVIIAAINSQGSSEPTSKTIGMFCNYYLFKSMHLSEGLS